MSNPSKQERLLIFYSQLLDAVDLKVDEDGGISYMPAGAVDKNNLPMKVTAMIGDGKYWVLPTKPILASSPWDTHMAFHPLSENILNGESEVASKLKAVMNIKLNAVLGELLGQLTNFAAHPDAHGNVPARASKFLKLVPEIKEKTAERMADMVERSTVSTDRRFVNLYVKRGGKILDSRFQHVGVVTFPFREELEGETPKAFNVTLSKKDQASFKALFDYIMPDSQEMETYSAGSRSHTASTFEAMCRAFIKVATQLNEITTLHKKMLPTYKDLMINLDWVDELSNIEKLADCIPPLPGNIGEGARDSRNEVANKAAVAQKVSRVFNSTVPAKTERETVVHRPVGAKTVTTLDPVTHAATTVVEGVIPAEPGETFAQRMARQSLQGNAQRTGTYGANRPASGAYGRNYGPKLDEVPAWANDPNPSRIIGGVDPKLAKEQEAQSKYGRRAAGSEGPVKPFSERMRGNAGAQNSSYARSAGGGTFRV
jgi:hypothetical protein